ncbi:MAG: hypothetical protein JXX28_02165 [Deltaproteobacteria bacterium]|nr:hypothetical protein [Deltaproteobacteria bacterium]
MGAVSLEALREQIRALEGAPVRGTVQETGVPLVDELLGGLPVPGLVELLGPQGSGRARLALTVVAALQRRGEWVCWVDFAGAFYPPAAAQRGVELSSLLVVRPPAGRGAWAVEQILRSGLFSLVVAADPPALGPAGARWARAAEGGMSTGMVLRGRSGRDLPVAARVAFGAGEAVVTRRVGGQLGGRARWHREGWSL